MGVSETGPAGFYGNAHVWTNVVAPKGPVGEKILASFGEGNIMELAAEVPNIDAFQDAMQNKGIVMTAGDDTPLPLGEKAVITPTGDRYAYFPLDRSDHGVRAGEGRCQRVRATRKGVAKTSPLF